MTVREIRPLIELQQVLKDPLATGPNPAYWVFDNLDMERWVNLTILVAGKFGVEYNKTFGHYHADGKDEVYHLISGVGLLLLQSEDEFKIIKATAGDEITIAKKYIHCWVNIGAEPLISYDDHRDPKDNYETVAAKHGLAYYIIEENGQPKAVPNPNYEHVPEPVWS